MADRDGVIWYDGKLVPWRDATTHVLTHTLHYGMGVFEGVRAYKAEQGTAIFRLQEHTDRLFRSAHILGMKLPFDKATISEAQRAVVRENQLESCYRARWRSSARRPWASRRRTCRCTSSSPPGPGGRTWATRRSPTVSA